MKVAKEETFGPLAPLFRFRPTRKASQMANDTEFGLAALLLQPRHRPHLARRRRHSNAAWSASTPA